MAMLAVVRPLHSLLPPSLPPSLPSSLLPSHSQAANRHHVHVFGTLSQSHNYAVIPFTLRSVYMYISMQKNHEFPKLCVCGVFGCCAFGAVSLCVVIQTNVHVLIT